MGSELIHKGWNPQIKQTSLANIQNSELVTQIHQSYLKTGAQTITTNTFDLPRSLESRKTCLQSGIQIAHTLSESIFVSLGPIHHITPHQDDYIQIRQSDWSVLAKESVTALFFETHTSLIEIEHLLQFVESNPQPNPMILSLTLNEKSELLDGTPPKTWMNRLKDHPFSALGLNCMPLTQALPHALNKLNSLTDALCLRPNWSFPANPIDSEAYLAPLSPLKDFPVFLIGGCCQSSPKQMLKVKDWMTTFYD